jgi:hypothetical protein
MKKIKYIGVGTVVFFALIFAGYLVDRFSYSAEKPYFDIKVREDPVLTVGIIGDSWVLGRNIDSVIHYTLLADNINNRVVSSGQRGAKSKLIYQNLFRKESDPSSSKFIIENRPDYCIVIAGVNDAVGQMGKSFYTHHMMMIIKTLLHYKIRPVVVELPEFGIIEETNQMGFIKKSRNIIFAHFTNSGDLDNINTYRDDFMKTLVKQELRDSILYVKRRWSGKGLSQMPKRNCRQT